MRIALPASSAPTPLTIGYPDNAHTNRSGTLQVSDEVAYQCHQACVIQPVIQPFYRCKPSAGCRVLQDRDGKGTNVGVKAHGLLP